MKARSTTAKALLAPCRPGFTLIEISLVMAMLAVAMGLVTVALLGAIKLHKACEGALERLGAQQVLADQFRADVAQAANAPERWKEDSAGPTCLILHCSEDRHVLYRWKGDRLERSEFNGAKARQRLFPLDGEATAVELGRSGPDDRLLTLRLFALRKNGGKEPLVEITAALGGDRQ